MTLTRRELYEKTICRESFLSWLMDLNILKKSHKCKTCKISMILINHHRGDGYIWSCKSKKCNKSKLSVRTGSVFAGIKAPLEKIIFIIYEWCAKTNYDRIKREYNINYKLFSTVLGLIRRSYNRKNSKLIGGDGKVVEIDESALSKRKYNIGRGLEQVWVVGGICRITKECFFEITKKKDSATLDKIILDNVKEYSVIITDEWKGYCNVKAHNYAHFTVKHKTEFLCKEMKEVHTQNIENQWRWLKKYLKSRGSNIKCNLKDHINDYLFLKKENPFSEIINSMKILEIKKII